MCIAEESTRGTKSDVSNPGMETRMAILTRGKGNKTVTWFFVPAPLKLLFNRSSFLFVSHLTLS